MVLVKHVNNLVDRVNFKSDIVACNHEDFLVENVESILVTIVAGEALVVERWNRRHPDTTPRKAWLQEQLEGDRAPIVAASDWMTAMPDLIAPWIDVPYLVLGTDGFGLSDTREALRAFFSVDAAHIAAAAMVALSRNGDRSASDAAAAIKELGIDPELQPVFVLDR